MLYTERAYFYKRYKVFFLLKFSFDLLVGSVMKLLFWFLTKLADVWWCWFLGFQIRGIKNLIFYSLPERKEFYPEVSASLIENELRPIFYQEKDSRVSSFLSLTADNEHAWRRITWDDVHCTFFSFWYAPGTYTSLIINLLMVPQIYTTRLV